MVQKRGSTRIEVFLSIVLQLTRASILRRSTCKLSTVSTLVTNTMVASLPSRARFGVVSPASLATITIAVLFSTGVILYYFPNAISRTHEEPKEIFEPKERSRPKRRPEPCVTLRIFNVPIDRTRQSFEDELKAIAAQVPAFHDAKKTLKYVTLVRRDQMRACGTATFYTSLPNNTLAEQLQTISGQEEYPYKFDSEFYGITPLYEHESDSFVDLVAVTGLGGHAFGSWRSPNNDEMWLRDYLPTDIPNHRIIVYGYNTKLQGNESKQSIEDLGARFMESLAAFRIDTKTTQRPIIFIGHSLGGLLVKEVALLTR
ncbi:hypothetical protein HD806DRAFT_491196 [Xylariaceae sp. AK1471]|nr:hypothetical protein HD806DRAFT_491196 [Xylariaceae sp. AK1471]